MSYHDLHMIQSASPPILPATVLDLIHSLASAGGRPLLVGGWVRDRLLGLDSKDLDIEVFGLPINKLQKICRNHGRLMMVGAAFAVLKLTLSDGLTIDISIPRRETVTGLGHKEFAVHADPFMSIKDAANRRDLTINAISMDPLTGEFLDPVNGIGDLHQKVIRHIGPRFAEDPLRVLRVYQFEARFGFDVVPETRHVCREIAESGLLTTLPKERIEEELRKLFLRGLPEMILKTLHHMWEDGVVKTLFPELAELEHVPQDPKYHSEGDVLEHTFRTVSEAVKISVRDGLEPEEAWHLSIAALLHDIGKKSATSIHDDGRITAYGHDEAGMQPAENLLTRITANTRTRDITLRLVRNHMRPLQLATADKVSDSAIRRLALALSPSSIDMLCRLVEADTMASIRGDGKSHENAHVFLSERARHIGVRNSAPEPFIHGRDLMELAAQGLISDRFLKGGPHFSKVLNQVYQSQLDGLFENRSGALQYLKSIDLDALTG